MKSKKANLILHPVRLRIILALIDRQMTAGEINEQLKDIPRATLYRHLKTLTKHGLLQIVEEHRVRNTLEKVYGLPEGAANLTLADLQTATSEEHMRMFTIFVANLLRDFETYLENCQDGMGEDIGYHTYPIHLNETEFAAFTQAFNAFLIPYLKTPSSPERKRRMLSLIMIPDETRPETKNRPEEENEP